MAGLGGVQVRSGWGNVAVAPLAGPPAIGSIACWLDADAIGNGPTFAASPARGGKLSSWPDLSTNNTPFVQVTGANQPTYTDRGANQHAKVTFDGTASFMTATVVAAAPCSVYAVAKLPIAPGATSTLFSSTAGTVIPTIQVTTGSVVQFGNGALLSAGTLTATPLYLYGESGVVGTQIPSVVGGDVSGAGGFGNDFMNSVTATHPAGTITGNTGFSGVMTIGAQNAGGGQFCAMDLYELVIFTIQLTLAQRVTLLTYFTQKYNLGAVGIAGAFS